MSRPFWVTVSCTIVLVLCISLRTVPDRNIFCHKLKWARYILLGNQHENTRIVIIPYGDALNWDRKRYYIQFENDKSKTALEIRRCCKNQFIFSRTDATSIEAS